MTRLNDAINNKLKPMSSIEFKREIVKTISPASIMVLNNSIKKKIKQNKTERIASEQEFSNKIM